MSSKQNNYYEILGVKKSATLDEINKAYRKKMTQFHPDKHMESTEDEKKNAQEMSSLLNKAKAILSDPDKRKLYDMGGEDALNQGEHHGHHSTRNEDRNDFDIFHGYENIKVPIEASLKKLYTGTTVEHAFSRVSFCSKCNGAKTLEKNPKQCGKCNGMGTVKSPHPIHPMMGFVTGPCGKCNNTGLDSSVEKCKKCRGIGHVNEDFTVEVKIPKGAHQGFPILVDDIGNVIPNKDDVRKYKQERTNVVFVVQEKSHKFFKRDTCILRPEQHKNYYADLMITVDLTFAESIIGFERTYEHLDGKSFVIRVEKPSKHGSVLIVENFGMPYTNNEDKKGDLFVMINVKSLEMKKTLSGGEKQKICQLLGVDYVPVTSTKSCEISPIEEKYNIEKNDNNQSNDSGDEEGDIPAFLRGMAGGMPFGGGQRGGTQRVVIEGGQQCPMQ